MHTHTLFNYTEPAEGPDAKNYFADDLFVGDAADRAVARVDGNLAIVSHHEEFPFRYLVRQLDVGFAVRSG